MLEYTRQCIHRLNRKRSRTLLTILSIAIGVASVIITKSIGTAGMNIIEKEMQSLGMDGILLSKSSKESGVSFSENELDYIRNQNQVDEAIPVITAYTQIKLRNLVAKTVVWGIDRGNNQVLSIEPIYGRMISRGDIQNKRAVCVADVNTANSFYFRDNIVGKNIEILVNNSYQKFLVIGVVNSGGNIFQSIAGNYSPGFVYIPYTTMQEITGKNDFGQIAVKINKNENPQIIGESLINKIDTRKIKNEPIYQMENMSQHREELSLIIKAVSTVISAVAGISLIVSGLGVMTVMLVSVKERTREIGIKKSIGATSIMIMREFMIEAIIISLIGSIAGIAAGIIVSTGAGIIFGVKIPISILDILFCISINILLGIIFGVYPSYQASKLLPVNALRLE